MADIFGNDTIEADNETEVTLATLVGDTQKYKTPDDLARAYAHADTALATQKARVAELEAETKVLRDLAEARNERKPNDSDQRREDGRDNQPDQPSERKSETDISELVRKELNAATEAERKAQNINRAAETMNKHYGSPDKAQAAIRRKAEEMGVSADWLRDVAATSPQAFLASMGIDSNRRSDASPGFSNERTAAPSSGKRDFSYWEDMRKNSPKAFYSAEVQKQMFNARRELGEKFYS